MDQEEAEASTEISKQGLRVKLRLKGNSTNDETFDPYLAKHLNAWKVKAHTAVRRGDPRVVFSIKEPYPYDKYEPFEITVRTEQILPMYAFNLNRNQTIPRQVQRNISELLRHRPATKSSK